MNSPIPPPFYPRRPTSPLAFLAKSFVVGIGMLVCIGIIATIASSLPATAALWFVLAVWWLAGAALVFRLVRYSARRRRQRAIEDAQFEQQYQAWLQSMAMRQAVGPRATLGTPEQMPR